jgi:hemoglobin
MRNRVTLWIMVLLCGAFGAAVNDGAAAAEPTGAAEQPDPDAQVMALEEMCAATAAARADRHEQRSLYERLGKEEGINALTKEVVRLHLQNDAIGYMFEGLDADKVAHSVALFMISGMGGPPVYEGPSLTEAHRDMKLTNADFMAAGSDIVQAMKNLNYGQNEIDEVVCALVGLRPMVVLEDHAAH